MLGLEGKDIKDLGTLKQHIALYLAKHHVETEEEISPFLLKEVFLETKKQIQHKTAFDVSNIDFPADQLFAWVFSSYDWQKFRKLTFLSMKPDESERTELAFKQEYPTREIIHEERVKNLIVVLKNSKTFYLIALSSLNRESLRHEMSHYFEHVLGLKHNALRNIWSYIAPQ